MYRAKEDGRSDSSSGTYRIFDPTMDQAAQAALQLKLELRPALARSEFRLHFQPIVNVKEPTRLGFRGPHSLAAPFARPAGAGEVHALGRDDLVYRSDWRVGIAPGVSTMR